MFQAKVRDDGLWARRVETWRQEIKPDVVIGQEADARCRLYGLVTIQPRR
jgi:hypothetical protein